MITDINQLDLNKSYTYKDYLTWNFPERVELLMGKIFKMSPDPSRYHQKISRRIFRYLDRFLSDEKCELYHPLFDVVLKKGEKSTVVQPDLCVICDKSKLTDKGCTGAPELVVEILSPGNSNRELKDKFKLYEQNGVQEYWIVDPNRRDITIYTLNDNNKYIGSKPFTEGETLSSLVLDGLKVDIENVFRE